MKKLFVMFMGFLVLSACATTTPTTTTPTTKTLKYEGVFVPEELAHKFGPGADEYSLSWKRPGYDFAKYNKFMVDYVVFALDPKSDYKGINADEMKQLADAASKALVLAISSKYEVVSEPGPDVARVRFAIVDLKQSSPAMSTITSVVPVGLAISLVKKGVTDEWTGGGLTKAEVLIHDSMTGEVIAAGYGDYSAKFTERFSKWGQVEDAFTKWGNRIDSALTSLKAGTFMTQTKK